MKVKFVVQKFGREKGAKKLEATQMCRCPVGTSHKKQPDTASKTISFFVKGKSHWRARKHWYLRPSNCCNYKSYKLPVVTCPPGNKPLLVTKTRNPNLLFVRLHRPCCDTASVDPAPFQRTHHRNLWYIFCFCANQQVKFALFPQFLIS